MSTPESWTDEEVIQKRLKILTEGDGRTVQQPGGVKSFVESNKHSLFHDDPLNAPHKREYGINRQLSIEVVKHLSENEISETAEFFDIGESTVSEIERYWNPEKTNPYNFSSFDSSSKKITDRECGVMREMSHDGKSLREIAEWAGVHHSTVQKHVSEGYNCKHRVEVQVPRVNYSDR